MSTCTHGTRARHVSEHGARTRVRSKARPKSCLSHVLPDRKGNNNNVVLRCVPSCTTPRAAYSRLLPFSSMQQCQLSIPSPCVSSPSPVAISGPNCTDAGFCSGVIIRSLFGNNNRFFFFGKGNNNGADGTCSQCTYWTGKGSCFVARPAAAFLLDRIGSCASSDWLGSHFCEPLFHHVLVSFLHSLIMVF